MDGIIDEVMKEQILEMEKKSKNGIAQLVVDDAERKAVAMAESEYATKFDGGPHLPSKIKWIAQRAWEIFSGF